MILHNTGLLNEDVSVSIDFLSFLSMKQLAAQALSRQRSRESRCPILLKVMSNWLMHFPSASSQPAFPHPPTYRTTHPRSALWYLNGGLGNSPDMASMGTSSWPLVSYVLKKQKTKKKVGGVSTNNWNTFDNRNLLNSSEIKITVTLCVCVGWCISLRLPGATNQPRMPILLKSEMIPMLKVCDYFSDWIAIVKRPFYHSKDGGQKVEVVTSCGATSADLF